MSLKRKKLKSFIVLSFLILNLFSCKERQEVNTTENSSAISTNERSAVDYVLDRDELEKLNAAVLRDINDFNWFRGPYSIYEELENMSFSYDIYYHQTKANSVDTTYSLLLKEKSYLKYFVYNALNVSEHNGEYRLFGYSPSYSYERLKEQFDSNNYHYLQSNSIQFGQFYKPIYPNVDEDRKQIGQKIAEAAMKEIEKSFEANRKSSDFENAFVPGSYQLYVRNFRDHDNKVFVVIEGPTDNGWILEMSMGNEGTKYYDDKFTDADTENYKYIVERYKELCIFQTSMELKRLGWEYRYPVNLKGF